MSCYNDPVLKKIKRCEFHQLNLVVVAMFGDLHHIVTGYHRCWLPNDCLSIRKELVSLDTCDKMQYLSIFQGT